MVVTPNTNIVLLKTPIELDSLNQLTFSNATAQFNYFNSLPKLSYNNATYQRKDGVIAFPTSPTGVTYEDLIQYNYCMYQNTSYDNKWFYAYITKITYDNNGMSYIKIETDVFQTWQFDITYKPSFIEREMLSTVDDVIGANTLPENLETGEYMIQEQTVMSLMRGSTISYICVAVTEDLFDSSRLNTIQMYYLVPSGVKYILLKDEIALQRTLYYYANQGKSEAILSIFPIPASLIAGTGALSWNTFNVPILMFDIEYYYFPEYNNASELGEVDITVPTNIQGYVPLNKKLLTFPYCFIRTDNGCGLNSIYRFENSYIVNNKINFYAIGTISPGCDIKVMCKGYNGGMQYPDTLDNYSESFNLAKFPLGGWINDPYTNWLTQNGVNLTNNVVTNAVKGAVAGSIFAGGIGGVAGLVGGFLGGVQENYAERETHDRLPIQAEGNLNSSNIMFVENGNRPIFQIMTIRKEFARCIDDFFSAFGYKTNRVKLPNLNNRTNWNYVKTKGCNIIGDIPQEDLQKIKDLFNNGITLWHNASTFLDYSQSNT